MPTSAPPVEQPASGPPDTTTSRLRSPGPAAPRRGLRRFGTALVLAGLVVVAYALATLLWRDPVTDLYQRWQQQQLASELDRIIAEYHATDALDGAAGSEPEAIATAARRFERGLELGAPLGRIVVPRLGLSAVFVHGTRWRADLTKGPGHYAESSLPGLGKTAAIAGHRTTFGGPFRRIDRLRRGDQITLRLPYGTFQYRVFAHEIVANDDWRIIRPRGFDTLVLSACHPLYSAKQRWVVFARLVEAGPSAVRDTA